MFQKINLLKNFNKYNDVRLALFALFMDKALKPLTDF